MSVSVSDSNNFAQWKVSMSLTPLAIIFLINIFFRFTRTYQGEAPWWTNKYMLMLTTESFICNTIFFILNSLFQSLLICRSSFYKIFKINSKSVIDDLLFENIYFLYFFVFYRFIIIRENSGLISLLKNNRYCYYLSDSTTIYSLFKEYLLRSHEGKITLGDETILKKFRDSYAVEFFVVVYLT